MVVKKRKNFSMNQKKSFERQVERSDKRDISTNWKGKSKNLREVYNFYKW